MYAAGAGVPINKIEAARLYNKAADGGLPQAGARPTEKYLRYIERDGVTREGARGQLYGSSIAASIRQTSVPLNNPVVVTATSFVSFSRPTMRSSSAISRPLLVDKCNKSSATSVPGSTGISFCAARTTTARTWLSPATISAAACALARSEEQVGKEGVRRGSIGGSTYN